MKLHTNVEWLKKRYVDDKKTIQQIADEAKVSFMTIYRALDKNGIKK